MHTSSSCPIDPGDNWSFKAFGRNFVRSKILHNGTTLLRIGIFVRCCTIDMPFWTNIHAFRKCTGKIF